MCYRSDDVRERGVRILVARKRVAALGRRRSAFLQWILSYYCRLSQVLQKADQVALEPVGLKTGARKGASHGRRYLYSSIGVDTLQITSLHTPLVKMALYGKLVEILETQLVNSSHYSNVCVLLTNKRP